MVGKKTSSYLGGILLLFLFVISCIFIVYNHLNEKGEEQTNHNIKIGDNSYTVRLLKEINNREDDNFLVSPYSIKVALNMLASGAEGETKEEIINLIGNDFVKIPEAKNKVNVANAIFIKEQYEKAINESFLNNISEDYQGEMLFDEFKTPNVINNWVNEKTYKMIPKLLDEISSDFVLGLANAVAVDVDWANSFDCSFTYEENFKKSNKSKMKVSMMTSSNQDGLKYIDGKGYKGIIVPYLSYNKDGEEDYDKGNNIEFIGILPNEDVDSFISNLSEDFFEVFDKKVIEPSDEKNIVLKLPIFSYSYTLNDFKKVLMDLGVKKAFFMEDADFTNIITKDKRAEYGLDNIYVDEAIHKTFIDLNEKGTKAAAVTYFGLNETTSFEPKKKPKIIEIKFDKPFLYMIRDTKTKELLFLGVVYEPSEWKGETCE